MLRIMGEACATTGSARSFAPADSSTEVFRKVFWTTAMSVPLLSYRRSHSCSKEREKPTRATKAPIPMPIPQSVSRVLSRLRQRFFQANQVGDNCMVIVIGRTQRDNCPS